MKTQATTATKTAKCWQSKVGTPALGALGSALAAMSFVTVQANAEPADSITRLLQESASEIKAKLKIAKKDKAEDEATPADPRAGEKEYEQARSLMRAVDAILADTAEQRSEAKRLPGNDDFLVAPLWTETKEDRQAKIRDLLDSALGIVTDVPVVEVQKRVEELRQNIRQNEDHIAALKEKRITAPKDGLLPGVLTDTVESLATEIKDTEKRIEENEAEIIKAKKEIRTGLRDSGVDLTDAQLDLLLDGVLSGDLVRLVAVFNAAKLIDRQLGELMGVSGDNLKAARKYFAMHATLFAMLVHAQNQTIEKIDKNYLPKLNAILNDIAQARAKTRRLLKANNRPDQKKALRANQKSQQLAEQTARGYKRYLQQQREQIARARTRATHDLNIADNTYDTVEASFQLRNLMRDGAASFDAIQKLEAPTFDQIFKNEELRREFENLTRRLDAPTS